MPRLKEKISDKKLQDSFPAFIIGGAAKSGTTSLSRYLNQHPGIFIPEIEPNFFTYAHHKPAYEIINHDFIYDSEKYTQLLKACSKMEEKFMVGEKSVSYLYKYYCNQVIENIFKFYRNPQELKWIFILRNPAERAFSQYIHNLNFYENLTFEQAVNQWEKRKSAGWIPAYDYLGAGFYSEPLKAYLDNFTSVRIYLFEDLTQRPLWLMNDLLNFLNVDGFNNFTFNQYNKSLIPKNKILGKSLKFTRKSGLLSAAKNMVPTKIKQSIKKATHHKPVLSESLTKELAGYYSDEIIALEKLINRNLSAWVRH